MGQGDGGVCQPPGDRRALRQALAISSRVPDAHPEIPFRYALDQLERRYGQAPGSSRSWDPEDILRALDYTRLEAEMSRHE